jgi:CBS domain-containing protein
MSITIRHLMTTPVVTVRRDTPFKQIVARVRAARVGAVPVIDDSGLVIGTVSAGDLLAREARLGGSPVPWAPRRGRARVSVASAGTLMTTPAVTIQSDAAPAEAARLMCRHGAPSLPVVDAAGRLVGIVSRGDILGMFMRPDAAIRREIVHDVIVKDFVLDPHAFTVVVRDGVVTLAGHPETDAVGHYLVEVISRVDGVIAVRDQLSYAPHRARRWLAAGP